jgi:hypothetical protein
VAFDRALDYLVRTHAFTSSSKHSINFSRTLEERQILLSLHETDLEVREVKLIEEQVHAMHSFDERYLSMELEEIRTHVAEVEDEHVVEARGLTWLVLEIQDIPQLLKMAHEVLAMSSLILERLREEHASGTDP